MDCLLIMNVTINIVELTFSIAYGTVKTSMAALNACLAILLIFLPENCFSYYNDAGYIIKNDFDTSDLNLGSYPSEGKFTIRFRG